jgi:hypothetical protein
MFNHWHGHGGHRDGLSLRLVTVTVTASEYTRISLTLKRTGRAWRVTSPSPPAAGRRGGVGAFDHFLNCT